MTKLQFIIITTIIFLFGCFAGWILKPKEKETESIETEKTIKLKEEIDSLSRLISNHDKQLIGIKSRCDLLLNYLQVTTQKEKIARNEIKNFNDSTRIAWKDSIIRANKLN